MQIQTSIVVNPGDSGGPLINMQGQIIGMNDASILNVTNIGFAIPSNNIQKIIPQLILHGSYKHAWLGMAGNSITPDVAQNAGLPRNYKGVIVDSVESGSPAEKAGIKDVIVNSKTNSNTLGDIITAIDGHTLKGMNDIVNYIGTYKSVGDNLTLTINRNGRIMDLNIILTSSPSR